jgi:hypothetical protein
MWKWRGATAGVIIGLVVVAAWMSSRAAALERQLVLREQLIANYQLAFEAIAQSGKVRQEDLAPLVVHRLGAPEAHEEGEGWIIDAPERRPDLTDFPELSVEFDRSGVLSGAHAHKP